MNKEKTVINLTQTSRIVVNYKYLYKVDVS